MAIDYFGALPLIYLYCKIKMLWAFLMQNHSGNAKYAAVKLRLDFPSYLYKRLATLAPIALKFLEVKTPLQIAMVTQ